MQLQQKKIVYVYLHRHNIKINIKLTKVADQPCKKNLYFLYIQKDNEYLETILFIEK